VALKLREKKMKKNSTVVLMAMAIISLSLFGIGSMPAAVLADTEKIFADTKNIKAFCEDRWAGDAQMQKQCMKNQFEGIRALREYIDKYDLEGELKDEPTNPYAEILLRCLKAWEAPKFNTYDYEFLNQCFTSQVEAYESFELMFPSNKTDK
jgi:hypothetical protein